MNRRLDTPTMDDLHVAGGPAASAIDPSWKPDAEDESWRSRAHAAIPGGCHTAAKGDDQYPATAPAFIARGQGCHIWDHQGRKYIEYAPGLRSVTLGHAWPSVVQAAHEAMQAGLNFNRPTRLEVQCAERFLELVPTAEMVKFTKDGSTVMTAALKLARAHTGRDLVAICSASPFFSYDDWFIGTTTIDSGIPQVIKDLTLRFTFNDIDSLSRLFDQYPGRIAAVMLEPARTEEPRPGFLAQVRELTRRHGAVLVFDETITGFRWHRHGAQHLYGVTPDLSCFGKAMGNGFSISALAGCRELMQLGGLHHKHAPRVFLLSTTHGAESVSLAAACETMRIFRDEPVTDHLHAMGEALRTGLTQIIATHGLEAQIKLSGRGCSLVFATLDADGQPSQPMRTLFLQEMIARGVLAPSLLTTYSHTREDIDATLAAADGALAVYRRALDEGVENFLIGPASASAYRAYN
ncbi:MAG: glutamate-1-semialdehyde 2,1-aminomutase [Burkholderiaceae bacterium]